MININYKYGGRPETFSFQKKDYDILKKRAGASDGFRIYNYGKMRPHSGLRTKEIDFVLEKLEKGQSCAITGTRKIGTTTLMLGLKEKLQNTGIKMLYLDCSNNFKSFSDFKSFLSYYMERQGFEIANSNNPVSAFPGDGVLLIDEFSNFALKTSSNQNAEILKYLFSSEIKMAVRTFPVLFAGIEANETYKYFCRSLPEVIIGRLSFKESELIVTAAQLDLESGLFLKPLCSYVYEYCGGHPLLTQMLMNGIFSEIDIGENEINCDKIQSNLEKDSSFELFNANFGCLTKDEAMELSVNNALRDPAKSNLLQAHGILQREGTNIWPQGRYFKNLLDSYASAYLILDN